VASIHIDSHARSAISAVSVATRDPDPQSVYAEIDGAPVFAPHARPTDLLLDGLATRFSSGYSAYPTPPAPDGGPSG
jgi:hypothetical protein